MTNPTWEETDEIVPSWDETEEVDEGPSALEATGNFASNALKVLDAPAALVRGGVGAVVGTKSQGATPWSAPSTEEIIETVAPATAKPQTYQPPFIPGVPNEAFLTPEEMEATDLKAKPSTLIAAPIDLAMGAGIGKGLEKGAKVISKGVSEASKFVAPLLKPNAKEISKAAKELGTEATPGMLDAAGFVERLESTLTQSPSIYGRSLANRRRKLGETLDDTTDAILKEGDGLSPYQTGEEVKKSVFAGVAERKDPIAAVFDDVREQTKHVGMPEKSLKAIERNIIKLPAYRLIGETGKAKAYVNAIPKLQNADEVKTLRTLLGRDISSAQGAERQILREIDEKLMNLEKNSIIRAAIQVQKESGGKIKRSEAQKVARDLIGELKEARSEWAKMMSDLTDVAKSNSLGRVRGPESFLDAFEGVPSERIIDKLFNTRNVRGIEEFERVFPEAAGLVRSGKINELSTQVGDQPGRFAGLLKQTDPKRMGPEVTSKLFGEQKGTLENLRTVGTNLPRNFNPSGTADQLNWFSTVRSSVTDLPRYLHYKAASNYGLRQGMSDALEKTSVAASRAGSQAPAVFGASGVLPNSSSLLPISEPEPQIEGIPLRMTAPVPPEMIEQARIEIKDSGLNSVERAKRMQLLNKHGRVVMGP